MTDFHNNISLEQPLKTVSTWKKTAVITNELYKIKSAWKM